MFGQGSSSSSFSLAQAGLLPQEEMLEVGQRRKKLNIGILKETMAFEHRVVLTPEAVENLVNEGHDIYIAKGAGEKSNYPDIQYSEKGGVIAEEKSKLLNADIILKVGPLTHAEIDGLKGRQIVISSVQMYNQNLEYFQKLISKKVTAIAFEMIRDEYGFLPVVQSMNAIAGNAAIIIAGEYLSTSKQGKGVMLGSIPGITPTEVIVLGADTAAEYAIRSALGMGASVKVFDNSVQKLRMLQEKIAQPLHTSVFHPKVMKKALRSADVVVGSVYIEDNQPYLVTEDMVKEMKPGTIIIDISIDEGGCIETTEARNHHDPVVVKHGVIHYGVPNLPSRVARTASIALSNVISPMLMQMGTLGGMKQFLMEEHGVRHGVYVYNGILTKAKVGQRFGIPSKDIDLLMAAF
jgi:alanine dehydrogenase